MEIELIREYARELQNLCIDIISKEKKLEVLETFDSSKMSLESQLNHGLMKLTESVKGNKHNSGLLEMAKKAQDELSTIKNSFKLDDNFIPVLQNAVKEEQINLSKIIEVFKKELPTLQGYSKESQEKYIVNLSKRKEYLSGAAQSLDPKQKITERMAAAKEASKERSAAQKQAPEKDKQQKKEREER